jgi:hypothetical protein
VSLDGLRVHRLCNRRLALALFWTAVLIAGAIAANVVGIYLLGSLSAGPEYARGSSDQNWRPFPRGEDSKLARCHERYTH